MKVKEELIMKKETAHGGNMSLFPFRIKIGKGFFTDVEDRVEAFPTKVNRMLGKFAKRGECRIEYGKTSR